MTNVILDLPQVIDYASFAIDPSNRCERRAKGVAPRSGLMMLPAAWRYDNGLSRGAAANAAKYLAAEAGFKACQTAVLVHGGCGHAGEYHLERCLRETTIPRIAPVTPQLILCFIPEKVLGLPKSSRASAQGILDNDAVLVARSLEVSSDGRPRPPAVRAVSRLACTRYRCGDRACGQRRWHRLP